MPGRRLALLLAALTLVLGVAILATGPRRPPLPVLSTLPPFSLRSSSGGSVSLDSLKGKVWIADFIFTRCVGSCPVMTAKMAEIQRLGPPGLRLVSFTVDPEHDTPEVLDTYARRAGAGKDWAFVTGAKDALYALSTQGFRLAAMEVGKDDPGSAEGPFLHSSRLVLVDGRGRIRGYYDTETPSVVATLLHDLRTLGREHG